MAAAARCYGWCRAWCPAALWLAKGLAPAGAWMGLLGPSKAYSPRSLGRKGPERERAAAVTHGLAFPGGRLAASSPAVFLPLSFERKKEKRLISSQLWLERLAGQGFRGARAPGTVFSARPSPSFTRLRTVTCVVTPVVLPLQSEPAVGPARLPVWPAAQSAHRQQQQAGLAAGGDRAAQAADGAGTSPLAPYRWAPGAAEDEPGLEEGCGSGGAAWVLWPRVFLKWPVSCRLHFLLFLKHARPPLTL